MFVQDAPAVKTVLRALVLTCMVRGSFLLMDPERSITFSSEDMCTRLCSG
jgi:hypothetical protein